MATRNFAFVRTAFAAIAALGLGGCVVAPAHPAYVEAAPIYVPPARVEIYGGRPYYGPPLRPYVAPPVWRPGPPHGHGRHFHDGPGHGYGRRGGW